MLFFYRAFLMEAETLFTGTKKEAAIDTASFHSILPVCTYFTSFITEVVALF
jgi:hypothetical protein